jgi:hypothetical protein
MFAIGNTVIDHAEVHDNDACDVDNVKSDIGSIPGNAQTQLKLMAARFDIEKLRRLSLNVKLGCPKF